SSTRTPISSRTSATRSARIPSARIAGTSSERRTQSPAAYPPRTSPPPPRPPPPRGGHGGPPPASLATAIGQVVRPGQPRVVGVGVRFLVGAGEVPADVVEQAQLDPAAAGPSSRRGRRRGRPSSAAVSGRRGRSRAPGGGPSRGRKPGG